MRFILGSFASSIRKKFSDTFDRSNSTSLDRSSDGSIWRSIRGAFQISSNAANSNADSNYPLSVQDMPTTNNQIDIYGATQGSSAALWVTDSGNWWAVGIRQEPTNCNCTYYYNTNQYSYTTGGNAFTYSYVYSYTYYTLDAKNFCIGGYANGSNCNNYACNGYNTSNCNNYACNGYNTANCIVYNGYNYKNKTGGTCAAYNTATCIGYRCSGSYNASNCVGYRCSGSYNVSNYVCTTYGYELGTTPTYSPATGYTYAYDYAYNSYVTTYAYTTSGPYQSCQTCYPQYIRIIQSVANTVSTITEWALDSIAQSFRVKNVDNQITISAYSDANQVTQIGTDLVYTPTGATITTSAGIMVSPSSYNQGYSIDAVEIKSI